MLFILQSKIGIKHFWASHKILKIKHNLLLYKYYLPTRESYEAIFILATVELNTYDIQYLRKNIIASVNIELTS